MDFIREDKPLLYRITGPQSIERLDPLLQLISATPTSPDPTQWTQATEADERLSFVWETACEKTWREKHSHAAVLNRLHNSHVLEDKSSLAFLQLRMDVKVLETYVARSPLELNRWARNYWSDDGKAPSDSLDWWAVKAAKGNGGKDVWIANKSNFEQVVAEVPKQGDLVIQRYVDRPMLWQGKKFHLRCYSMIKADLTPFVYEKCFILTAGHPYQTDTADMNTHITNLSVNKHIAGYPGQIPCFLPEEFPEAFGNICKLWKSVVSSVSEFMREQPNENHFEFFGIDIIVDCNNDCWLVEINRLPGLESSKLNKEAEDLFYNKMMLTLLRMVTRPLLFCDGANSTVTETEDDDTTHGHWRAVGSSGDANLNSSMVWKNIFKWKIFTSKNRSKVYAFNEASLVDESLSPS